MWGEVGESADGPAPALRAQHVYLCAWGGVGFTRILWGAWGGTTLGTLTRCNIARVVGGRGGSKC
jgi:hypothetical protein